MHATDGFREMRLAEFEKRLQGRFPRLTDHVGIGDEYAVVLVETFRPGQRESGACTIDVAEKTRKEFSRGLRPEEPGKDCVEIVATLTGMFMATKAMRMGHVCLPFIVDLTSLLHDVTSIA
jgi:hypothetical protein